VVTAEGVNRPSTSENMTASFVGTYMYALISSCMNDLIVSMTDDTYGSRFLGGTATPKILSH
jgi:hypothetical protein